ncbi:radical SAM protein [Mucilaginibacter sp. HMF5004]|uniref:GTP 3',8-cyclase MoaA n=1 Tax=Mucilaginibacter rivuli TaxID=2857527 RepID=UPI001C5D703C|nr:radical SAM protein [Mucilaginibacter rivuli]MBW4889316.1 radical SAM protein [Mucilaginibacter rivuli]
MMDLQDKYGRDFKTLRVSLLSTCNLGCVYCTMGTEEEITTDRKPQTPAAVFLRHIRKLHEQLDLKTIRFTGGEPLLYRELPEVIAGVRAMGIEDIKMTSNAFLLDRLAPALKDAGLQYINVSLDAMDSDSFFAMTRRKQLQRTLKGIETALACGLDIKLNAVMMKGKNDDQVLPLLEYAFKHNIRIRFLEVMAMGHLFGHANDYKLSQDEILDIIATRYSFNRLERKTSSTANYWQTDEGHVFGIIANDTEPFCMDCNRLRLDAEGNIYGCLSTNKAIALSGDETDAQLQQKLQMAMAQKQDMQFTGSEMSMLHIGG